MKKPRVGVIMGGTSGERQVSLQSGKAVAAALQSRGHDVVMIDLDERGDPGLAIRRSGIDLAFIALHGRLGEDGCAQGLCELYGIPYTGSSVLASALAMNKAKAKELFRLHNLPTPPYYTIGRAEDLTDIEEIHGSFGFPVVVKPCGEGSSLGVSKANSFVELSRSIGQALSYDETAVVERYVRGKEVQVGLLNGRVLGAIEIAPKKDLYDYEAKYTAGMSEYFVPARLPATRYHGVLNLGERAAAVLGCTGAVRVDLLVTEGQNEYVLEVNTLPGMTKTSLMPKIAEAAGLGFEDLCEAILGSARLHASVTRRTPPPRTASEWQDVPVRRAAG